MFRRPDRRLVAAALSCASPWTPVHAQEAGAATAPAETCCTVAAGTVIEIEIAEALDSALRKRGDRFAISLHAPVTVGDTLVIPAGTPGVGEVVHAERVAALAN